MQIAFKTLLLAVLTVSSLWSNGTAQIIHTPVNTSLGGGGTAYTTGYESLFINPANLFIQEKDYRFQISAGTFGSYITSPQSTGGIYGFRSHFLKQVDGFDSADPVLEPLDYNMIINRNYSSGQPLSEHLTRGEIHWLGMHWSHPGKSYALAARSRFANRYITGRAYYDPLPAEVGDIQELNRSLAHQYQSFHEISFGYAESFSFVNGLFPQLGQLIIGISPKLIVSGAYLNMTYEETYRRESAGDVYQQTKSYDHYTTGAFSHLHDQPADQDFAGADFGTLDLFQPTGMGAGLDAGLTWLITLGDDLSVARVTSPDTRKSLRVSFSITDVGFVNYYRDPDRLIVGPEADPGTELPGRSPLIYHGSPGEHVQFLLHNNSRPFTESGTTGEDTFSALLPTALHGGLLFQVSRVKLMGDMSLGLTNNAFNSPRLITYIGTEIRPFTFLPIRAGTRIARDLPDYYSIGAGIETRYFEVGAALQFRNRPISPTGEITGMSIGALKILIP